MSVSPPPVTRARTLSSVALALGYVALFAPIALSEDDPGRWYGLGVIGVQVACLMLRWRLPRVTLVVSLVVASIGLVAGWNPDPCVACACVLYSATVDAPAPSRQALWTAWIMLAGTIVVLLLVWFGLVGKEIGPSRNTLALLLAPTCLAASWVLACSLAARRDR